MKQFTNILSRIATLAVLTLTAAARADIVPADRRVDWTPGVSVGVPGGVDQYLPGGAKDRTTIVDVTKPPYNADRTGTTDASAAIQAAIEAAAPGTVIYLPTGRYRCDRGLNFSQSRDNLTLRGDGAGTVIDSRDAGIYVGSSSDYMWTWPTSGNAVTGGLQKGSSTVTVGSTTEFAVGKMVQFSFANDNRVPVLGVGGGDNFRRQLCMVTGKTATTLTFTPALYEDYGAGTIAATAHVAQFQTDFVGIEDLVVDFTNSSTVFGIEFEQAYGCWIKNVRVSNVTNYAFFLYDSLNCEIRTSFADQRKGGGSNGSGILCNRSSACLVEDNIVYKFFPSIEVNQGSSGNVFGYNFCYDSDVYGTMGVAIDTNHSPHNSYNLYEGNISPNVQCDGYFGGASRDTLYRNWLHGTSPLVANGWTLNLNRFTRSYAVVGNILGTSSNAGSYSFGYPNMGNMSFSGTAQPSVGIWWADWGKTPGSSGFQERDLDVQASTYLRGNYVFGSGIAQAESLGTDTLLPSLYRAAKPSWFQGLNWPAFDPTSAAPSPSFDNIPAGYRYVHGSNPPATPTTPPPTTTPPTTTDPAPTPSTSTSTPTTTSPVRQTPVGVRAWLN